MLVADDVRMVEFFHDVDLLVDVLLKKGFLLDMQFADDLDCVVNLGRFCLYVCILCRASTTSPKAPFPIDLIIS